MTATWITVFMDGDYHKAKYKNLFAAYVHPWVQAHGGTEAKCVTYQDMTEAEYKFADAGKAKLAKVAITKALRVLPKVVLPKAVVTVMPAYYEKNGSRNIVRPDVHSEPLPMKPIAGFARLALAKKYTERPSPPLPANDYCGVAMNGYVSTKKKNGACYWALAI